MGPIRVSLAADLVHKERQVTKGVARVGSATGPPVLRRRPVVGFVQLVTGIRVGEAAASVLARRERQALANA